MLPKRYIKTKARLPCHWHKREQQMHASEQIFRCYPVPAKKKKSGKAKGGPKARAEARLYLRQAEARQSLQEYAESFGCVSRSRGFEPEFQASSEVAAEINRIGFPWAGPMLIFDCETLTGAKDGQGLRFGCFQERGWRYD
jgi:hypothetical protein